MKSLTILILFTITCLTSFAQNTNSDWIHSFGGSNDDNGSSISTDPNGFIYVAGDYSGTIDFDPGLGISNLNSDGPGYEDNFIQKLDPFGNLVWAKKTGGQIYNITNDSYGNIYTTGYFENTVDFDPGTGVYNLTSIKDDDIFIQKLDSNGKFLWAVQMGGSGYENGHSITIDLNGNIYSTGAFYGTVDFNPGINANNLTSNGYSDDIYIQKLDSNGKFLWAVQMGGSGYDLGKSIITDYDGNIYTTGYFKDTVDFDPGIGINNLISKGSRDIFIQKLDPNGNFLWVKQMGGSASDEAGQITIDFNNNLYAIGSFYGTINFNNGIDSFISKGNGDILIQKLNSNGNLIWAKQIGNSYSERGASITTDSKGYVYSTGVFGGKVSFNGTELTSNGGADIFIEKLDSNGNFIWVKQIGGPSWDEATSIVTDGIGNIYTTGGFNGTANFDQTTGTTTRNSKGNTDIYIQKIGYDNTNPTLTKKISDQTLCQNFSSYTIDLKLTFEDFETSQENLIYSVTGNTNIVVVITDGIATISSNNSWKGIETLSFHAEDERGANVSDEILFTVSESKTQTISETICYGNSFNTGNQVINNTGEYIELFTTITGCDSSVIFQITVQDLDTSTQSVSIIDGESYSFGTQTIFENGEYTEVFKNINNCDSTVTLSVTKQLTTGLPKSISQQTTIYPNPTTGNFTIESPTFFNNILIYNSAGEVVKRESKDLSNLDKGLYIIELQNSNLTIWKTIIKN